MDTSNEIDLGSNKKCAIVSFIKSPKSFWVRLEELKTNYFEMVKQMQNDYEHVIEETELSFKNLSLGSMYCVFNQKLFEWHRCEIIRINHSDISIFYIDIGSVDLVSIKSLKTLKDCYKTINRFALHCSIDNMKPSDTQIWQPNVITRFSEAVLFKMVTIVIKSKSENIYNVDMFLKTQNIAETLIAEGLASIEFTQSEQLKDKADLNTSRFIKAVNIPLNDKVNYELVVTCIYSPFCFYAQLSQQKALFDEFEDHLQNYYENESKKSELISLKKPRIGQMCIAKYLVDDAWYRAIIKEIDLELNSVVVFFIDYGNQETIQIDGNLLVINEQFIKYPCMGIMCCLNGIKPVLDVDRTDSLSDGVINLMFDSMSFKVMAKFIDKSPNDCYLVSVEVEEKIEEKSRMVNLSNILIQANYVQQSDEARAIEKKMLKRKSITQIEPNLKTKPISDEPQFKEYSSSELLLEKAAKNEFTITHVETICEFYIRISHPENEDEIRQLQTDLQYFYEKKVNLPQPLYQLHNACVYYDSDKKHYHRAQIINIIDANNCVVYLIDVGQKKFVNRTQIRDIYEKYLKLSSQVAQASLDDLRNQKAEEIDELLQAKFKEISLNKKFLGRITNKVTIEDHCLKNKYFINLFDSNDESVFSVLIQDINHSLISDNLKPNIKSKLEETNMSINETINDSISLISKPYQPYQHNDHDYRQQSIDEDVTSPFPKHDHSAPDQTDLPRAQSKTQLTLIETADKLKQLETDAIYYYDMLHSDIDEMKAYPVTVTNYENALNFTVQFTDLFVEFDEHFDDFQASCSKSKTIENNLFKTVSNVGLVAIAARFYDDQLWYRARIIDIDTIAADNKCLIEFIDYGNKQLTLITDCVFLNFKYAKFKPSTINCSGIAYITATNTNLNDELIENMLYYCKTDTKDLAPEVIALKHEHIAYFVKKIDKFHIEIDDLYAQLHKLKLLDLVQMLKPNEYSEMITRQANENHIRAELTTDECKKSSIGSAVHKAIVTDLSGGLRFIYVNMQQTLPELKQLEKELERQPIESLVKLNFPDLKVNNYYLVKNNGRLYRCLMLTPLKGSFVQMQLIDYGTKITVKSKVEMAKNDFFVLNCKYFKYNTFAMHCRLPFASNIEKVWLKEEKEKFYLSIKPKQEYLIKIMSDFEPYIIEFIDNDDKIDFKFNAIINRINKNELEPQLILNGNKSMSLSDDFYLGGAWLRKTTTEFNIFIENQLSANTTEQESIFIYSNKLHDTFKYHLNSLEQILPATPLAIDLIKKGDLVLIKRKTKTFLDSLRDDIRPLIETYLSRVRVKSISTCKTTGNKTFSLFYCDYGFTDFLQVSSSQTITTKSSDYEFYTMTLPFKLWPTFAIECVLNRSELIKKLINAKDKNDFIDAFYLNGTVSRLFNLLATKPLKADFTQGLQNYYNQQFNDASTASNVFAVDLMDGVQSLIDTIIDYGLKDIENHSFLCAITHFNHLDNFYMQKFDDENSKILDDLQDSIQRQVASNLLKPLDKAELNKLCIAFYNEDQQYYRAKIISFSEIDQEIEVFYIDYGNTSKVLLNQIKEISRDLVDNLPKAFSISCELDVTGSNLKENELEDLNKFFSEIVVEDYKFDIKFKSRKENKYNDTACYIIEMKESEKKLSILELFKQHKSAQEQETSNVNYRFSEETQNDISSEDDQALAESLTYNNATSRTNDETNNFDNTTLGSVSKSFQPDSFQHMDPSWVEPYSKVQPQQESRDSTLTDTSVAQANLDPSWTETSTNLKYYDYANNTIDTTLNRTEAQEPSWVIKPANLKNYVTQNDTMVSTNSINDQSVVSSQSLLIVKEKTIAVNLLGVSGTSDNTESDVDESEDANELYSTADEQSLVFQPNYLLDNDKTLEQSSEIDLNRTNEDFRDPDAILIKKCMIAFLTSSQSFYLQAEDFNERIDEIKPVIEECFDPFDTELSSLCIGQWSVDEQYYRMRLLDWQGDQASALCFFIDYGNTEQISKDTITAMSDKLTWIKPLAFHCKLYTNIDDKPNCFHNLEELVNDEMTFDAIVESKIKLDEYYALQMNSKQTVQFEPLNVRLYLVNRSNYEINEQTLGQDAWSTTLQYIKTEPLSILIDPNETISYNQKNCVDYATKFKPQNKDDEDEDDRSKQQHFNASVNQSLPSSQNNRQTNNTNTNNTNYGKPQMNEIEADQAAIDQFIQDEENTTESFESNDPEAYMYPLNKKNLSDEYSELASLRGNSTVDDSELCQTTDTVDTTYQRNLTVSQFHDEESNWTKTDLTLNETAPTVQQKVNQSTLSEFNQTQNDNENLTVSQFHDQESNWSLNLNNETIKPQIIIDDSLSVTKLNDMSKFHDQSSNWEPNKSVDYISKSIDDENRSNWSDDYKNKESNLNQTSDVKNDTIGEFHDQDSNWSVNQTQLSGFQTITDEDNKNLSISHFPDQDSNWTQRDESNQNLDVSKFHDQESNWTISEDKSVADQSYLSKTINENNVSVWHSDINQTIFDSRDKKINRKLNVEDDSTEENEKVEYIRFHEGFVMRVNSLDDFYIQLDDADTQLMNMKTDLEKCRKPYEKAPQLGTICVAPYHIDQQYYRAQIIEIDKPINYSLNNPNSSFNTSINKFTDSKVKVHYIDYGNEAQVDLAEIFKITLELKNIAPLALNCRLNLTKNLKNWINKMADLKQDVSGELTKCFKRISSKSKIKLKVIKEVKIETKDGESTHIRPPPILVDAFLGEENICDSMLLSTIISYQPNSQTSDLKILNPKEKDFDGYLINLKPFDKMGLNEVSVQNQSVLKLIDDLFQNYNNLNDCSSQNLEEKIYGPFCFAPLPETLVQSYKLKNGYSRVAILEKNVTLNQRKALVHFIDFDFKQWIDMSHLMMINSYLSQIQSSVERFSLNIVNINDLNSLNNIQLEHLNEIFKMLIECNKLTLENPETKLTFNWSAKFKTVILTTNSNVFSNKEPTSTKITKTNDVKFDSIRLYDTERELLDINRVIEMCISIMARPFTGHITHIESDFSQFECINSASSSTYLNELQKLYRATGYFADGRSPEKNITNYKVGQLCLVNEKSEHAEIARTNSSESILSLNGLSNDNQEEPSDTTQRKGFFRGVIIDESNEKCVVLNVDNGKKMTLMKRRIQVIEDNNYSNRSRVLIRLIPFMLIRARPKSPIMDSNLKRILSNSRFYLETIKLNIIGSWTNSEICYLSIDSKEKFADFIQNEKDLNKIIELLFESNTPLNQQQSETVNKISSISIMNSFNKRKQRNDEPIEQSANKISTDIESVSKNGVFFKLSNVQSLGCFYIQSTESLKTIEFIEEQIQLEHSEINRSSKMSREDPKIDFIYGIYSDTNNKYYRILLKNKPFIQKPLNNVNNSDSIYEAFYLDYGFSSQINSKGIIFISEYVQQFAPQAVCCKLNGFLSSTKSTFADADNTSANEANISHLSNYDTSNETTKLETDLFNKIIDNKPFMATVYKRFSHFNKIENMVPLQTDNYSKQIEIVIHLFDKIFDENLVDDLESRSVTYMLKRMLNEEKKSTKPKEKLKRSIQKFNIRKYVNSDQEIVVEFGHLATPNKFYLHLTNWSDRLNELTKRMELDYKTLSNRTDLQKGDYCAYIVQDKSIYKRAFICDLNINLANIYLIDSGEYVQDTGLDKLFNLLDTYHELEPLCFECTLGLQYPKSTEDKYIIKLKTMIQLSKHFKAKILEEFHPYEDKTVYLVNLFGSRASAKETDRFYNMNISEELRTNNPVFSLTVSSPNSKQDHNDFVDHSSKNQESTVKRLSSFKESEVRLKESLKIQLTNVDTIKHFGIVLNADLEKRHCFISNFHQWHKENKKSLKPLFASKTENIENRFIEHQSDKKQQNKSSYYIGMPCAVSSIQIGKYCRGVITSVDFSSQLSSIYLVDYCRSVQIATDRIFKIENKEFLEEPIYAHRCQLADDPAQKIKFEKYLDLLKGSVQSTVSKEADHSQDHLNSSHIAMENIEIQIVCLTKASTLLNQMTTLQNDQYTINVVDFKRLRTSFPVSPFSNIGNSSSKSVNKLRMNQSIGLSPLTNNVSEKKFTNDSTTENILYKENSLNHIKTSLPVDFNNISNMFSFTNQLTRSGNKANFLNLESEQSIMNYTNETSFTNFSVTESTRISPTSDENNTDDDITPSNEQTIMSMNEYNAINYNNIVKLPVDKREETTNWVNVLENVDESTMNNIETKGSKLRVRILPNSFNPSDFICQKLNLLDSYEELLVDMNEYYQKQSRESSQNTNENVFVDSLEGEKTPFSDMFKIGDYCAAKFGKFWNRCRIIDIEANKLALIECIDDFRSQRVHLNKLEKLQGVFKRLPRLAIKCRLASFDSAKLFTFNQTAIEKFKMIISEKNKELISEIVSSKEEHLCHIYEVNLFINNKYILDFLKELSIEIQK